MFLRFIHIVVCISVLFLCYLFDCTGSWLRYSGASISIEACRDLVLWQGLKWGPLHWEFGVLGPGPPHFFSQLKNNPLYGCTTFYLSFHHLMDNWVVSTFWTLWIMLLWTFVYKLLCGYRFLVSWAYIWVWNCWVPCWLCVSSFEELLDCLPKWLCYVTGSFIFKSFDHSREKRTLSVFALRAGDTLLRKTDVVPTYLYSSVEEKDIK